MGISTGAGDLVVMGPVGPYSYTHQQRWLAGGYYDADDLLQLVTPLLTVENTVTFEFSSVPHASGNETYSGSCSHQVEFSAVLDFGLGVNVEGSGSIAFGYTSTGALPADFYSGVLSGDSTETYGSASASMGGWDASGPSAWTGHPGFFMTREAVSGVTFGVIGVRNAYPGLIATRVIRFSSRCWGILAEGRAQSTKDGRGAVLAYVSPEQVIYGPFEFALADGPGYATAHPVTGEITASLTESVCVV